MTTLTREMVMLLVDGREYRVAFMRESDGTFEVVDRFIAIDDAGANAYAETYYADSEWYVLNADGKNINGGPQ